VVLFRFLASEFKLRLIETVSRQRGGLN